MKKKLLLILYIIPLFIQAQTVQFLTPTTMAVNENAGTLVVPVLINGSPFSSGSFTVDLVYDSTASSATRALDLQFVNQTITFANNQDTQYIAVNIIDDCFCELIELGRFKLVNASLGISIGTDSLYDINLLPNDTLPMAFFPNLNQSVIENAGTYNLTIDLSYSYCDTLSFNLNFTNINFQYGYSTYYFTNAGANASSMVVTFLPGQTNLNVSITVVDNNFVNPPPPGLYEIFLSLTPILTTCTSVVGSGLYTTNTITINDDEIQPWLYFTPNSGSYLESDGLLKLPVIVFNGTAGTNVWFTISLNSGTATVGADLQLVGPANHTLSAGQYYDTVKIFITDDLLLEPNETFTVSFISAYANGWPIQGNTFSGTIVDNDVLYTFGAPLIDTTTENAGAYLVPVIVHGNGTGLRSVDIFNDTANTSALVNSDFTFTNHTINFSSSNDTQWVSIPILNDCIPENMEHLKLHLSNATSGKIQDSIFQLFISDNDQFPTVGFLNDTTNNAENTSPALVKIELSNVYCDTVAVAYKISSGTATLGSDYNLAVSMDTIYFSPGDTIISITVPIINDAMDEPNETVFFELQSLSSLISVTRDSTVLVILDDDLPPTPNISFVTAHNSYMEDTGIIAVPITIVGNNSIAVQYTVTFGGTAVQGAAYNLISSATRNLAPGVFADTLFVQILDDLIVEPIEYFTITLNTTNNCVLGSPFIATDTIIDNDPFSIDKDIAKGAIAYNPNPIKVGGQLNIVLTEMNNTLALINLSGEVVFQKMLPKGRQSILLPNDIVEGVYFMKIVTLNKSKNIGKLIVVK
jgi:hypothetical protein